MEKKVSIRDIAKLHVSQQLERKKAILLNLELDTCMRAGKEWIPITGIFTWEDRKRYEMDQKIMLPNGTFTKQFSLPNYFRGENAYVTRGRHIQEQDMLTEMEQIPGVEPEYYGDGSEWLAFTSNFDQALLHACCKWDKDAREWRPLTEDEIHKPEKEGDADYRYGVIYMAKADDERFSGKAECSPACHVMTPAGILAERGQRQYTFAMRMQKEDTLQEDACFDRLIFEHTEDFCRDVCELMTGLKKF